MMNLNNYKFINAEDGIYAVPLAKWKKYLKLVLAYKLSLLKKNPLQQPVLFCKDIKLVAHDIFELNKLTLDDCVDVVKEELIKLETSKVEV
jgi:hypothetical protein